MNVIFYDRVEKMVSGKYLGEVGRTVLAKLTRLGAIFGGQLPKALTEDRIVLFVNKVCPKHYHKNRCL